MMTHTSRMIWLGALAMGTFLGCEVGPPGDPGAIGPVGPIGAPGKDGKDASLAHPECPIGYAKDAATTAFVLCKKGDDEVVRVGAGGSSFWIDRYEASVRERADGTGALYGLADDYPSTFPRNGQWQQPLYAISRVNEAPSRSLTWFQAQAACNLSGKRLPTRNEWLEAARGTSDPGVSAGAQGQCLTQAAGPRSTGGGAQCRSRWGAEDMIGNLSEWTDEWYAGVGQANVNHQPWPQDSADYGSDGTWNIASGAIPREGAAGVAGLPAAASRGGCWAQGLRAGLFNLDLVNGASSSERIVGFRCVVPR